MSYRDFYRGSRQGKRAIDETGRTLAGVLVIEAVLPLGGARFRVRHPCGCLAIVTGVRLRQTERAGKVLICQNCKRKGAS